MVTPPTAVAPCKGDVLVVDDLPQNLELLVGLLRSHGYVVRVAVSGERALAAAWSQRPDAILLDVAMPGMDGYAVCERLRADARTVAVPIIFVSAQDDVFDKVRAFRAGGSDYVTKPFQLEEVLTRLEHQLKLHRLQTEMEQKNRELERKNRELMAWQQKVLVQNERAAILFSAYSETLPGSILDGRYRLESKIGSGAFGVVFRAHQIALGRDVAVKIFQPASNADAGVARERFLREGVSACRVSHPNAVMVLDSGIAPSGVPYIVMELLSGHSLAEEMRQKGPLPPRRCAEIAEQICAVLAAAHAAGIIHRDVKPQNVMLHRSERGEVVKVVDFGLAKLLDDAPSDDALTATTAGAVGTPAYMAPEVLQQAGCDGRSDVYSVGVVLYRMLSGKLPHGNEPRGMLGMLLEHLSTPPIPLRRAAPGVSSALEKVVMSALHADPAARPDPMALARRFTEAAGR
jgi:CheY-like chemotaxis protein